MTEDEYMDQVRAVWANRVRECGLKGAGKDRQAEAFLQGVIATATATGVMNLDRAAMIHFLVMVGRIHEFLAERETEVAA